MGVPEEHLFVELGEGGSLQKEGWKRASSILPLENLVWIEPSSFIAASVRYPELLNTVLQADHS